MADRNQDQARKQRVQTYEPQLSPYPGPQNLTDWLRQHCDRVVSWFSSCMSQGAGLKLVLVSLACSSFCALASAAAEPEISGQC